MSYFLQNSIDPPDYNWPAKLYRKVYPTGVANGSYDWLQSCGIVGGKCEQTLDCHEMTRRGYGHAFYIFEALKGFHTYINAAHRMLVESTTQAFLEITQMKEDFSLADEDQIAGGIKAYVSASLFVAGGVAGSAGLAMRETQKLRQAYMGESRTGSLGAAKADLARAQKSGNTDAEETAKKLIAALERDIERLSTGRTFSAVMGGLICKLSCTKVRQSWRIVD